MRCANCNTLVPVIWVLLNIASQLFSYTWDFSAGKPLSSTGFARWASLQQPDNAGGNENCGSIHRNGGLNDIPCPWKLPFFCEHKTWWHISTSLRMQCRKLWCVDFQERNFSTSYSTELSAAKVYLSLFVFGCSLYWLYKVWTVEIMALINPWLITICQQILNISRLGI